MVKVNRYGPPFITILTIIEDLKLGIPNFLFGNKCLQDGCALLSFTGCIDDPQPELIFKNPIEQQVTVSYAAPRHIYTAIGKYTIPPLKTRRVKFYLHSAAQVICTDIILLTPAEFKDIHVLPSRSELIFDDKKNKYYVYGA
ncbi:MAG: hypothetical protein ACK559_26160, partial [bacterium]